MAVHKTKSVNDLQKQLTRIVSNASFARSKKAEGIYKRYRDNIQKSLGYSYNGGGNNTTFSNPKYQSVGEINNAQVSRSTYMGLSKG